MRKRWLTAALLALVLVLGAAVTAQAYCCPMDWRAVAR